MTGYRTYTRYQRIEAQAKMLGFKLGNPKFGQWATENNTDEITLYPDDDALPIYSRDADIYTGTFNQVEIFLNGWIRAQQYDAMLRMSNEKKRKKYEDKERERQLREKERLEKRLMFAALADKTEDQVDKLVK